MPTTRIIQAGDAAKLNPFTICIIANPALEAPWNSLVANDGVSNLLVARRSVFSAFLARYGLFLDIAFALSESLTHTRATSWYTTDDDTRGGMRFTLDGSVLYHRYFF